MITFAYTECDLSLDDFFNLSWYEWSLEIEKVSVKRKRDLVIWEGNASLIREQMALLANCHRDFKKKATPYKGSDFFKLSFDEKTDEEEKHQYLSPEQVIEKFSKMKAKNGK